MITPIDLIKWAFAILLSAAMMLVATLCIVFVISLVRELISPSRDDNKDDDEWATYSVAQLQE